MERFQYQYRDFKGLRCDIILAGNHLYVAHDPESISSLTWDHLLEKDSQKKMFWLDVKNLSIENVESFLILPGKMILLLQGRWILSPQCLISSIITGITPALVRACWIQA